MVVLGVDVGQDQDVEMVGMKVGSDDRRPTIDKLRSLSDRSEKFQSKGCKNNHAFLYNGCQLRVRFYSFELR
ncbi:hypothetical protein D3C72_1904290 [compost metagenome]